jgi:hypothetical protein
MRLHKAGLHRLGLLELSGLDQHIDEAIDSQLIFGLKLHGSPQDRLRSLEIT